MEGGRRLGKGDGGWRGGIWEMEGEEKDERE